MSFLIKRFLRPALAAMLITSLCSAPAQANRACFFVGVEPGSFTPAPVEATLVTLTHAFRNRESHVFVSYDAWNYIIDIVESIKKTYNIGDPFNEIAVVEFTPCRIPTIEALNKQGLTPCVPTLCAQLQPVATEQSKNPLVPKIIRLLDYEPHKWDMYDTHMGLYYFTPKVHTNAAHSKSSKKTSRAAHEISTQQFTLIENQFQKKKPISFKWVSHFTKLFNDTGEPWYLTFLGHGVKAIDQSSLKIIAGIPTAQFAQLLKACNEQLPVAGVTVSSCYVSPEVIRSTAKHYANIDTFNFDLVTLAHRRELAVYAIGARPQRNIWPAWLNRPQEYNEFFPSSALFITKNMDTSPIHAIDDDSMRKNRIIDIVRTNYDTWVEIIETCKMQEATPYHPCIMFKHEQGELVI